MAKSIPYLAGRLAGGLKRRAARQIEETRSAFRAGLRGEPAPPSARSGGRGPRGRGRRSRRIAELCARLELDPRTLERAASAAPEEVDRAFRKLVSRYHPDRFDREPEKARQATVLLQQLGETRAELLELLRGSPGA